MKRRHPFAVLLDARSPRTRRDIRELPLVSEVRVHTDRWGIPRIEAANESDLYAAQGWIHASQRLWQMESLRRFAAGRLAEAAGERFLELDHFARMAGFPEVCRRAVDGLSNESRSHLESYLKGVNRFIEVNRGRLPLEFRSAGITPEPWTLRDATANLVVNSWYLQTNYLEEVLAVRTRKKVSREQWDALLPGMSVFEDEKLPDDAYFEKIRNCKIGRFHPATYAFYKEFPIICGASNNWIAADGPGGLPLLANDPHLGVQLPQIWFAAGLRCPGVDILGVGMPGFPGVVIGRTPEVAWGFTNVMTDIVDLYVIPVDAEKHTCTVNGTEVHLESRDETFGLPDGSSVKRSIHTTPHGPLMTEIHPGVDAGVALKWYGTLPEGTLNDRSADGILSFSKVKSVADLRENGGMLTTIGQNIVAGDVHGDILWQTTGSIPRRKGYSGRLPADGSSSQDWTGFEPPDAMPGSRNPDDGWIVTANHRTVSADADVMPTRSWAQPWRFRRISDRLREMVAHTPEAYAGLQNDHFSLRPAHVLPNLLKGGFTDPRARKLAGILETWDGSCGVRSTGCLVFNRLPSHICETLLRDLLGDDLDLYFMLLPFFTGIMETLAKDAEAVSLFPEPDGSRRSLSDVMETALIAVHDELKELFGPNIGRWRWGRWHTLRYRHPGSKPGISAWLLDRGPWPVPGDWTTVNVCGFSLLKDPGEATTIPSMRFLASLDGKNRNSLCLPLGQSGRPGNRHYDDFAMRYVTGGYVPFPMDPPRGRDAGTLQVFRVTD